MEEIEKKLLPFQIPSEACALEKLLKQQISAYEFDKAQETLNSIKKAINYSS